MAMVPCLLAVLAGVLLEQPAVAEVAPASIESDDQGGITVTVNQSASLRVRTVLADGTLSEPEMVITESRFRALEAMFEALEARLQDQFAATTASLGELSTSIPTEASMRGIVTGMAEGSPSPNLLHTTLASHSATIAELALINHLEEACGPVCKPGERVTSRCSRDAQGAFTKTKCVQCGAGTFSAGGLPAECIAHRGCPVGAFAAAVGTADKDTVCKRCKTCGPDEFYQSECTKSADTACGKCKTCPDGSFQSKACSAAGDAVCQQCTKCKGAPKQKCSAAADAVCSCVGIVTKVYDGAPLNFGVVKNNPGNVKIEEFKPGALVSINDNDGKACYFWKKVPAQFAGAAYLRGDLDRGGTMAFEVAGDVVVGILFDSRSYQAHHIPKGFTLIEPEFESIGKGVCRDTIPSRFPPWGSYRSGSRLVVETACKKYPPCLGYWSQPPNHQVFCSKVGGMCQFDGNGGVDVNLASGQNQEDCYRKHANGKSGAVFAHVNKGKPGCPGRHNNGDTDFEIATKKFGKGRVEFQVTGQTYVFVACSG